MSVIVRPAISEDIDAVCDFLHVNMNAKISRERWRNILDYPWRPTDADRGRIALDGSHVIGFLGLTYVYRRIQGRIERFCNTSAWYLLRDYRGRGIGEELLRDVFASPDVTYTSLTATVSASQALRNRGLEVLDANRYLLRWRSQRQSTGVIVDDVGPLHVAEGHLGQEEQRIWRDHRAFNLRHILFEKDGRSCYIVLSVKKKGADLTYYEVLHASDLGLLADHTQTLANHLLPLNDAVFALDRRFLLEAPTTAEVEPIRLPRLYRSRRLRPPQIDHLYSEIVLLDMKLP